jgi:hypothetical protein
VKYFKVFGSKYTKGAKQTEGNYSQNQLRLPMTGGNYSQNQLRLPMTGKLQPKSVTVTYDREITTKIS